MQFTVLQMPAIWDAHFGFVEELTGYACVVGEWGGFMAGTNEVWMNNFVDYLISKNMSDTFYWCLNPYV